MSFRVHTGVNTLTLERAREMAARAERRGFDEVDFTDSAHEPFLPCVPAMEATERILVGTSVAIAFPRSPMVTAMTAWDLQRFSGGRFVLGLGSQVKGHNERRFSVPWSPPAPRLREYVLALRAIWNTFQTGERLDFHGEHYTFTLMTPNFSPGPIDHPHIPVQLAAVNTMNARVAGEVADGIKLHPFHSPAYLKSVIIPAIEAGLAKSGRARNQFEICGGGLIATGATEAEVEEATKQVRHWLSFYGSTRSYHAPLGERWADLGAELHDMSLRGRWNEMAGRIPDDLVREFAVVATYDRFAAAFKERYEGVVDSIGFAENLNGPENEE
ncbi:MAG: TIGR03617 family F420-dependent LLM class oxidoreductase, partial [Dehalococcoidia bacterium]